MHDPSREATHLLDSLELILAPPQVPAPPCAQVLALLPLAQLARSPRGTEVGLGAASGAQGAHKWDGEHRLQWHRSDGSGLTLLVAHTA